MSLCYFYLWCWDRPTAAGLPVFDQIGLLCLLLHKPVIDRFLFSHLQFPTKDFAFYNNSSLIISLWDDSPPHRSDNPLIAFVLMPHTVLILGWFLCPSPLYSHCIFKCTNSVCGFFSHPGGKHLIWQVCGKQKKKNQQHLHWRHVCDNMTAETLLRKSVSHFVSLTEKWSFLISRNVFFSKLHVSYLPRISMGIRITTNSMLSISTSSENHQFYLTTIRLWDFNNEMLNSRLVVCIFNMSSFHKYFREWWYCTTAFAIVSNVICYGRRLLVSGFLLQHFRVLGVTSKHIKPKQQHPVSKYEAMQKCWNLQFLLCPLKKVP